MRRGQGQRLPIPTEGEHQNALLQEHEAVAYSAKRYGVWIALKVGFHNGDTSTVSLDETAAIRLVQVLKALVPNVEAISPARVTDGGVREGHMSA
jgi:hypothetical protein